MSPCPISILIVESFGPSSLNSGISNETLTWDLERLAEQASGFAIDDEHHGFEANRFGRCAAGCNLTESVIKDQQTVEQLLPNGATGFSEAILRLFLQRRGHLRHDENRRQCQRGDCRQGEGAQNLQAHLCAE